MKYSDFKVPPFKPGYPKEIKRPNRYFWWSWHPLYPYWSKSCWGAPTIKEAKAEVKKDGGRLNVYHNKLIRENMDGSLTEVFDMPCKMIHFWERCLKLKKND
jgi:hypothetical protein